MEVRWTTLRWYDTAGSAQIRMNARTKKTATTTHASRTKTSHGIEGKNMGVESGNTEHTRDERRPKASHVPDHVHDNLDQMDLPTLANQELRAASAPLSPTVAWCCCCCDASLDGAVSTTGKG